MKRILAFIISLSIAAVSYAQETGNTSHHKYQNVRVKAMVLDAASLSPVPNVTVYLIPQGDTAVTNFSLSGENGSVVLENVVSGKYELNAEMLGYKTFTKVYDIYQEPGWDLDLGTIGMEESTDNIDASTITAAGNPITILNDTVIYHASSFRVGENAMLEDLLKKMPGIEISEDGTAMVNGKKVDRITVGGKTFFFGDPSMALKNLPAKIVALIKVSQQESRTARMGGISTEMVKETVMDIELKEEYKDGWFGDARIGTGATLKGKDKNPLIHDTEYLYDGSVMASFYGEKDQSVFIGNAYNVQMQGTDTGDSSVAGLPEDDFTGLGGLAAAVKGGANYNTDRIKNFATTVSANYRHLTKDERQRFSRTSFMSGGSNLLTEGGTDAAGTEDQLMVDVELSKEEGALLVDFAPRFYVRKSSVNFSNFSETFISDGASPLNTSVASSLSDNKQLLASGSLGLTGTQLGKAGRRTGFNIDYSAGVSDGDKSEYSLLPLRYDISGKKLDLNGTFFYYEPVGSHWGIEAGLGGTCYSNLSDRQVYNADGSANGYFTNKTDRRFLQENAGLMMQYSNDTCTVKFGFDIAAYQDAMEAQILGINTVAGRGDWHLRFTPVVQYSWVSGGHQLSLQYTSATNSASGKQMIPVPDISNPIQVAIGNIYLKSGISNRLQAYYNMVNYSTYTFLTMYAYADMENNGTVYASWHDNTGTRYAVPVNAKKPGTNANVYAMLNQPFGRQKNFTLSFSAMANFDNRYTYQAKSLMSGAEIDNFDYKSFMDDFWGDASGNRFYSGQSGFSESRTRTFNWGLGVNLKYNKAFFTGTLSVSSWNGRSTYSLDPSADMNAWNHNFGCDFLFCLSNDWEIGTDIRYVLFNGYAPGYGQPELRWNMSVNKTVKSLALGLKFNDILNQERSLARIVSSEYVEDSYRNVMGRTLLFRVSFNFGKLNSDKTSAVSGAIRKIGY